VTAFMCLREPNCISVQRSILAIWLRGHIVRWVGLLLTGLVVSASALSQTTVSGLISGNTIWRSADGPFIVVSDILVQNGAILTIEAGTTVYMGANTRFTVQSGALRAIGTAQAPIRFTSQRVQNAQTPAPGDWQQFTFGSGTSSSTVLEHVQIDYGSGIVLAGAAPVFNYLSVRNHQGPAISLDLGSSPMGVGNQAVGNSTNAILVPAGDIAGAVTWGLRGIPYLVSSGSVSVGAVPRVLSVTPSTIQRGETQTVTVAGSRLTGLAIPTFDLAGLTAQVLAGANDTQAQIQVTAAANAAAGAAVFTAQTSAGQVSLPGAMTVTTVQPRLNSVSPTTVYTEQGDTTLTLRGENFNNQVVVHLDATPLATTFVSATELSALAPNQTETGIKSVQLRTPNPDGGPALQSNALNVSVLRLAPVVNSTTPNSLRRGETRAIQILGTGLSVASLSASSPALTISNVVLTATQATFNLAAAANAPLGPQQITLSNSAGSAVATVTVNPLLPAATVAPTPIAIPPDSSSRQFAVQLSYADTVNHTFTVTAADPSTVSVSTPSLTVAAGQVQVVGSISGLRTGVSSLTLVSPTLGTLTLPVYVTADFLGLNTSTAPLLGVVLTPPAAPSATQSIFSVAQDIGLVFGNYVRSMSPKAFATDSGTSNLTIEGEGLQGAVSLSVQPSDGVSVGTLTVAGDGRSVVVPLTIAVDAPPTQRKIVLSSATGAYAVANPDADRILITYPRPEIFSLDPLFATPGTPAQTIVVRGRNFQGVQSLSISPAEGVIFGVAPMVSADGTQLTAIANIASSAALGPRVISAVAPSASSDTAASPANTFTLVSSIANAVTPIAAPHLGVVKLDVAGPAPSESRSAYAPMLGVTFGGAVSSMSPRARAIGETFTLSLQGVGLQNVTALSFEPATGITVGAPTVAADGASLSAQVSIAANAPQTQRAVRLLAGTTPILFAQPGNSVFTVTAPQPTIESIDPMAIQVGAAPVVMTVRGQNFQSAQSVRLQPSTDVTVSALTVVDAAATQLTVTISASSGAAAGPRALIVTTPGGETSAELTAANTINLGASISANAVVSPLLGVVKVDATVPTAPDYGPITAPHLGVVLEAVQTQPTTSSFAVARPLGVGLGAVAVAVAPSKLAIASTGTLTINGSGLDGVSSISDQSIARHHTGNAFDHISRRQPGLRARYRGGQCPHDGAPSRRVQRCKHGSLCQRGAVIAANQL
jgi:IPT/TIG domain